jgi:hypothetical protein
VAGIVALSLPTVWWTPLNVDEELTLRIAQYSFSHIFHIVSTQRGGGPVHFWLEHFLLGWWPSLPALRLPSLLFLCLAVPAVALIVRRLVDDEVSSAVVVLTAVSPIPILYATFGRPHTLLFAWLMWSTVLALKAAEDEDRRLWIAAGAALGLAVFLHPTAPLYALTAFGAAVVYAPGSVRRRVRVVWPGVAALLVTFVPYYVKTLHVLSDRYGVGASNGQAGRTFSGRPVWEDALHFVAPGPHDVNYFTVLAGVGVVTLAYRRAWRLLAFCTLTVAAPVVFFSVVPTNGDSALFFDRYMIPVTPAFLIVVCVGIATIAAWAGPLRLLVGLLLVIGLTGIELRYDFNHLWHTHNIGVNRIVDAVSHEPPGTVLFGSTGTSGAIFSAFDYGHPANVLDHLIALRAHSLTYVDDDACQRVEPFLRGPQTPRYGLWVFYAASSDERAAAAHALHAAPIGGHYFAVRSATPLAPRALLREGLRLRSAWKRAVPVNIRVDELLASDRQLLAGTCVPYGQLGDPDSDPHWPPVKTTHQ